MQPKHALALIMDAAIDDTLTDAAFRVVVLSLLHDDPPSEEDLEWARRELRPLTLLRRP